MSTVECMTLVLALFDADLVNLKIHCCVVPDAQTVGLRCVQTLEVDQSVEMKPDLRQLEIYLLNSTWDRGTTMNHWSSLR